MLNATRAQQVPTTAYFRTRRFSRNRLPRSGQAGFEWLFDFFQGLEYLPAFPDAARGNDARHRPAQESENMATFDLHFHTNIHRMPERNKRARLRKIARYLKHLDLDYLASTEHAYKKPLEAYDRLVEATADLPVRIIPGVEGISSEGIDIIFLYRSREALADALDTYATFSWSVRDVAAICRATDAISIVPHPFHMGRTSAGNILSRRAYHRLLGMADYVEIHNGSALNVDNRISAARVQNCFRQTQAKLDKTLNLPYEDRGFGMGWAVSSDAHYPGEQFVVGKTEQELRPDADVFDFLKQKVRFTPHLLEQPDSRALDDNFRLLRDFQCVLKEGLVKECIKTRNWSQAMVALCVSWGMLRPF